MIAGNAVPEVVALGLGQVMEIHVEGVLQQLEPIGAIVHNLQAREPEFGCVRRKCEHTFHVRAMNHNTWLHIVRLRMCPIHAMVGLELLAGGNAGAQVHCKAWETMPWGILKPPLLHALGLFALLHREQGARLIKLVLLELKGMARPFSQATVRNNAGAILEMHYEDDVVAPPLNRRRIRANSAHVQGDHEAKTVQKRGKGPDCCEAIASTASLCYTPHF
eukprot:CAMPEP_0178428466 /NCGR_PEP_ID=MMETSP0689_2-20121128/30293_1 /TAXON_ID=160604 /ORGANISM="Amphidinium massartii, Strain CS-259" /LENGTH=219 /DNA_ID=CAMNT_0020050241 /DNA_START=175 /DNA_END=835 /DNA_ORIENTATION=+